MIHSKEVLLLFIPLIIGMMTRACGWPSFSDVMGKIMMGMHIFLALVAVLTIIIAILKGKIERLSAGGWLFGFVTAYVTGYILWRFV